MYSSKQKETALLLYKQTCSATETVRILGYPAREYLYKWVRDENKQPKKRKPLARFGNPADHPRNPPLEIKLKAIKRCFENGENVNYVSGEIGYSRASIYLWRKKYLKKGTLGLMNTKSISSKKFTKPYLQCNEKSSSKEIEELRSQMQNMQMEIDILKETINVLKKDPGIDHTSLTNREKAVIIDALKNKYPLPLLRTKFELSKSSYYYQESSLARPDKYSVLREKIKEIFCANQKRYGYRRIHALLKREAIFVSEKIVRRIMSEEGLIVKVKKTGKYNSYVGEITPAVPNIIERNFSAMAPNTKWLTDITEFAIPAGKVYLSPIVDCFDGLLITWKIGLTPDSNLVNSMLDDAINKLLQDEKPIVHSDRGVHYRWPGWIERMDHNGLIRSMSRKGYSPDNSACEGVFGRLKNEMFYNTDWTDVSISDFIDTLNDYLNWYNESRIKKSLGYMSPMEYRRSLGLAA
ncbi:MAG: IS3 family transposase [Lachnospiraceae bacterium]|nr:IS3 family transposase [Lachnospiraceae bacterium]